MKVKKEHFNKYPKGTHNNVMKICGKLNIRDKLGMVLHKGSSIRPRF